jgi:hypothetical protein
MTTITTPSSVALVPSLETAWQDVDSSFERFCLTAGIGTIEQMLCEDAQHSPARRIVAAEAASATAGAGPKERSASMVARLPCIARGCAVTTAMKSCCRPGGRHRRKTGLAAGP